MNDRLDVFWDNALVGSLTRNDDGVMQFHYGSEWVTSDQTAAISLSLPKREEPFSRRQTRPFFAGLLPDEGQRTAAARAAGVSETNDYALLDALGGDVAGALTLLPAGERPKIVTDAQPKLIDEMAFAQILVELPRRPFLVGDDGIRMSLAGAQPKLPVMLVDNQPALPGIGQPTTHIVKPEIERFPGSVANEAFAMRLAAAVGLTVARVWPRRAGDISYLLVERFDRLVTQASITRLHQEDFCQAMGFAPEHKYAAEKGPSFSDCFTLVRDNCTQPATDLIALLDAAIFNTVIGNADAHGKNFSLLYRQAGITLAPLYDLMVTAYYPHVATRFAMPIGRANQLDDLDARAWAKFAADMQLGGAFVGRRVRMIVEKTASASTSIVEELTGENVDGAILKALASIVQKRANIMLRDL